MSTWGPFDLASTALRLRPDASIQSLSMDDTFWQRVGAGELGTFHHEFLVATYTFDADWPVWEMHPAGDEIVCLLSGSVTFVLERAPGREEAIALDAIGSYAIVPKGTWHTARTNTATRMLFITAGEGTEHRDVTR